MSIARPCAHPPCARTTRDPSGRCHDHRNLASISTSVPSAPAPVAERAPKRREYRVAGELREEWTNASGKLHREDGPAQSIRFEATGGLRETYHRNGAIHRVDGPAYLGYTADGRRSFGDYYFDDVEVGRELDLLLKLDSLTDERLHEEFSTSSYAPLLTEGYAARDVLRARVTGVKTNQGIREVIAGAPPEWVRSYEEGEEGVEG